MKKNKKSIAVIFGALKNRTRKTILLFIIVISLGKPAISQNTVTLQLFYDELGRYGTWISHSDYGYVWKPEAGLDFFPYGNNGYWLYTDWGWTWTSYYPWGWAAFHYGRWFYDPYYGWLWVPDYYWAPAWVVWCESPGYFGWAPLGPGVSITFALSPAYQPPHEHWRFLHNYDIGRKHISYYYVGMSDYARLLVKSDRMDHNIRKTQSRQSFHAGPAIERVKTLTGKGFVPVIVKSLLQPKEERGVRTFGIYKPDIKRTEKEKHSPVPEKAQQWRERPVVPTIPPVTPVPQINPVQEPERKREQEHIQDWPNKKDEIITPRQKPAEIPKQNQPAIPLQEPERKEEHQQIQDWQDKNQNRTIPRPRPAEIPKDIKPAITIPEHQRQQQRIDEIKNRPEIRPSQDKLLPRTHPNPTPPIKIRPEIKSRPGKQEVEKNQENHF